LAVLVAGLVAVLWCSSAAVGSREKEQPGLAELSQ